MFQDFKDLLYAFNAHSVKYLIVGGDLADVEEIREADEESKSGDQ